MSTSTSLTRVESYELGRAEYFNPANINQTFSQIRNKYSKDGVAALWVKYFKAGFFAASMLSHDEACQHVKRMIEADI